MTLALDLLKALPNDRLAYLVREHADDELACVLVRAALDATPAAPPAPKRLPPTRAVRSVRPPKPKALPPVDKLPPGRKRRSPGDFLELVYTAVIGSDEPLSPSELADAKGWNRATTNVALSKLVEAKRLFRARGNGVAKYAVTQAAADEAVR